MKGEKVINETIKYLNNNSNRVGEKLTEYDWRECCDLIMCLEELLKTGVLKNVELPKNKL